MDHEITEDNNNLLYQDIVDLLNLKLKEHDESYSHSSNSSSLESQCSLTNNQGSEKENEEESGSTTCSEHSFDMSSTSSIEEESTDQKTHFHNTDQYKTNVLRSCATSLSRSSVHITRSSNMNKSCSNEIKPQTSVIEGIREYITNQVDELDTKLPDFDFAKLQDSLKIAAKERQNIDERMKYSNFSKQSSKHRFNDIARLASCSEFDCVHRVTDCGNLKLFFVNNLSTDQAEDSNNSRSENFITRNHAKSFFVDPLLRPPNIQRLHFKLENDMKISDTEKCEILKNEALLVTVISKEKSKLVLEKYRKERSKTCDVPRQARQYLSKTKLYDIQNVKLRMKKAIHSKNMELVRLLLEKDNLHMEHDSLKLDIDDFTQRKFPLVFLDLKQLLKLQNTSLHSVIMTE